MFDFDGPGTSQWAGGGPGTKPTAGCEGHKENKKPSVSIRTSPALVLHWVVLDRLPPYRKACDRHTVPYRTVGSSFAHHGARLLVYHTNGLRVCTLCDDWAVGRVKNHVEQNQQTSVKTLNLLGRTPCNPERPAVRGRGDEVMHFSERASQSSSRPFPR